MTRWTTLLACRPRDTLTRLLLSARSDGDRSASTMPGAVGEASARTERVDVLVATSATVGADRPNEPRRLVAAQLTFASGPRRITAAEEGPLAAPPRGSASFALGSHDRAKPAQPSAPPGRAGSGDVGQRGRFRHKSAGAASNTCDGDRSARRQALLAAAARVTASRSRIQPQPSGACLELYPQRVRSAEVAQTSPSTFRGTLAALLEPDGALPEDPSRRWSSRA